MDIPNNIKCVIFDLDGTLANFDIDYDSMRKDLKKLFKGYGEYSDFTPLVQEIQRLSHKLQKPSLISESYNIIDKYELLSLKKCEPIKKTIDLYRELVKKTPQLGS